MTKLLGFDELQPNARRTLIRLRDEMLAHLGRTTGNTPCCRRCLLPLSRRGVRGLRFLPVVLSLDSGARTPHRRIAQDHSTCALRQRRDPVRRVRRRIQSADPLPFPQLPALRRTFCRAGRAVDRIADPGLTRTCAVNLLAELCRLVPHWIADLSPSHAELRFSESPYRAYPGIAIISSLGGCF